MLVRCTVSAPQAGQGESVPLGLLRLQTMHRRLRRRLVLEHSGPSEAKSRELHRLWYLTREYPHSGTGVGDTARQLRDWRQQLKGDRLKAWRQWLHDSWTSLLRRRLCMVCSLSRPKGTDSHWLAWGAETVHLTSTGWAPLPL